MSIILGSGNRLRQGALFMTHSSHFWYRARYTFDFIVPIPLLLHKPGFINSFDKTAICNFFMHFFTSNFVCVVLTRINIAYNCTQFWFFPHATHIFNSIIFSTLRINSSNIVLVNVTQSSYIGLLNARWHTFCLPVPHVWSFVSHYFG